MAKDTQHSDNFILRVSPIAMWSSPDLRNPVPAHRLIMSMAVNYEWFPGLPRVGVLRRRASQVD